MLEFNKLKAMWKFSSHLIWKLGSKKTEKEITYHNGVNCIKSVYKKQRKNCLDMVTYLLCTCLFRKKPLVISGCLQNYDLFFFGNYVYYFHNIFEQHYFVWVSSPLFAWLNLLWTWTYLNKNNSFRISKLKWRFWDIISEYLLIKI